jgi:hypothetical protein
MGMYDTVVFEGDLPKGVMPSDDGFETKSLFRIMAHFTITRDGRLIHNRRRYLEVTRPSGGFITFTPPEESDMDMNFHGDIVLSSFKENNQATYVARFTHGTLEWVRSIEALPAQELEVAVARNLET